MQPVGAEPSQPRLRVTGQQDIEIAEGDKPAGPVEARGFDPGFVAPFPLTAVEGIAGEGMEESHEGKFVLACVAERSARTHPIRLRAEQANYKIHTLRQWNRHLPAPGNGEQCDHREACPTEMY